MASLDERIVIMTIKFGGREYKYSDLNIYAQGSLYASASSSKGNITVNNLDYDLRNQLLAKCLPEKSFSEKPIIILDVGRKSTGTSTLFSGRVFSASHVPLPNLGITFECLTGYEMKYKPVKRSFDSINQLSAIAKLVASDNKLQTKFFAKDRNIKSYSYFGSASDEIKYLESLFSDLRIFSDGNFLYVYDIDKPNLEEIVEVSAKTGLLELSPMLNGIRVQCLYNPRIKRQSQIEVKSFSNPALNGKYIVYQTDFEISSRDTQFYTSVSARRIS